MSLRINQNVSAINAHRNLLQNDRRLSKSLERLSSGLNINRAADGPASLVISEQMRAQVGGLDQAIKNSEVSIAMVQTAESALNEVNSLLVSARQLAIHAANEGANDEVMLQADQQEIINAISSIDRIGANTQFGTKKLLDGSRGANGLATGDGLEFVKATTRTKSSGGKGFDVNVRQAATQAQVTGETSLTEDIVEAGETLTISEGGKSASFTSTSLDTIDSTVQNLSSAAREAGLEVIVAKTDDDRIRVRHKRFGSEHGFQVASSTVGVLSKVAGEARSVQNGLDLAGTVNGEATIGKGQTMTGIRGNPTTDGLAVRFAGELPEIDRDDLSDEERRELEDKGTPVGRVNVTQNSLVFQVGANRDQTVSISLNNTTSDKMARGIENKSDFRSLKDVDVTTPTGAQDALGLIDAAINETSATRADLGSFQKNTLESNLNNLRSARENLIAAESSIRDADMASEVAEFTRNKIMMQSAAAMLTQANQVPNQVLRLLKE